MDHAIFCRIHFAHYRLRQYLRHAHKKVPLFCEKHLPTKYSGYATEFWFIDCVEFSFHQLTNSEAMLEAAKVTLEVKMVELEEEKEGKFIASYHYPQGSKFVDFGSKCYHVFSFATRILMW